ncbi:MAG: saccharopine dehydrogenase NADP-binding domain-containing protein [Planctomycetes bacterium]|nr:saccharopine dehydrogenase NADP-binding domain-containing protein [Planctomycetota bacterium]
MRYAVLGAGRQGLAIAYDLVRRGEAKQITLVDSDGKRLAAGVERLKRLAKRVAVTPVEARLEGDTGPVALFRGHDCVVSALPYKFNNMLSRASIRAQACWCDLGGHTKTVEDQVAYAREARVRKVTVVPDCGLAPGLANVLAAMGVAEVPGARHVRIRVGGLPVPPKGPLGYSLLFSIEGLTNEYTGEALMLREGKVVRVEAFTELEPCKGPKRLGPLECFLTSGGTSLAPMGYRGKLETYEYKTIRYKGHFAKVRPMIELGLLSLEPVAVGRAKVVPRDVFHAVVGPRLDDPAVRDIALLQCDVTDAKGAGIRYRMVQQFDERTGFTAMEQTTGYPTAAIAHALARRILPHGTMTPDRLGLGPEHLKQLRRRGLKIRRSLIRNRSV